MSNCACVCVWVWPAGSSAAGSGSGSALLLLLGRYWPMPPVAASPLPWWPPLKRSGEAPGRVTSRTWWHSSCQGEAPPHLRSREMREMRLNSKFQEKPLEITMTRSLIMNTSNWWSLIRLQGEAVGCLWDARNICSHFSLCSWIPVGLCLGCFLFPTASVCVSPPVCPESYS